MGRLTLICPLRGFVLAALLGLLVTSDAPVLFAQAGRAAELSGQFVNSGGFVQRVFKDATGEHKYMLFIPRAAKSDVRRPVILYLHGAGERGTDGVLPTTAGLGPFLKERSAIFPFYVVFPQCEDTQGRILTAWSATSPDGKRALAILDAVEKEFSLDRQHCVLTGWSMGGYGTWSLGTADPKRWSALVPVAGGGDPAWAPKLKNIPIWSFEGANDQVVPARASREMVDAVRAAGGHPLDTQVPDVGHDIWKVAYNDNRVYQWMLAPTAATPAGNPAAIAGNRSATGPAASFQPRVRRAVPAVEEGPFIPAVTIPNALYLRLGNDAIRALAHSAPRLIPQNALSGRINDIFSSTESSGYTFSVQFSNISYSGQVDRIWVKAYAKDLLNIQLALRNVALTIGTTYVQGSGRSAVAGPISVVIANRYPIWLSFDVTPYVNEGKLRLQLVSTNFQIPNDDWYVTPPYGVGVRGLGMTQEKVSSGLVEGIYGQKSRIEQEASAIVPAILPMFEQRLAFDDVTQAASAFWPLPVYRPRLRVSPASVAVDEDGISLVMDVTAAAADPRKAPATPRVEPSAGVTLDSVPHDKELRLGLAPNVLAPLTQTLIDEGVARVNVLDIPDNKFAAFADRKALAEALPDVASLPPNTEINAELVLAGPVQVHDFEPRAASGMARLKSLPSNPSPPKPGQPVSVTALKANADSAPVNGPSKTAAAGAPSPRPFEFVVPKATIEISTRDDKAGSNWRPYAVLQFDLTQEAQASVLRRGFAERALRIGWTGEPVIKASARFAKESGAKDSKIDTDKLRELFTAAWKAWTQNGNAAQVPVSDVDFGYAKLRMDGVDWSPPVFSVLFDEPGVKITNSSSVELVYQTKDIYSRWSDSYHLKPGKSDEFTIADPLLFRRVAGGQLVQTYTLPAGSHCDFRSPPGGGAPDLFQVPPPAPPR